MLLPQLTHSPKHITDERMKRKDIATIDIFERTMILFIDVTKKSTTFHLLTNFNPILPRCQQFFRVL